MFKRFLPLFGAVCLIASLAALPASAQDKMGKMGKMGKMEEGKKMPMDHGKMKPGMMSGKAVYACAECKMYYSSTDAKKMSYKDSMGHKLKKMMKAPAGYKMGHMGGMKMKGKM